MNPEPTPSLSPLPEQPQAVTQAPAETAAPVVTAPLESVPAATVETTIVDQSADLPAVSTVEVPMIAEEDKITPPVVAPTMPVAPAQAAPTASAPEGNWSQKGVVLTPNESQAMTEGKLNQ